jgi:TatA/E family protein of Tat protein translocase
MGISGSEIFLIFLFILIFFGADKIPEFARMLGKGYREFKKAADEIKSEISADTTDLRKDFDSIKEDLKSTVSDAANPLNEIKNDIKNDLNQPLKP